MKKKLMTLLMSAVMALGISASAFAAPVGVVNVNAVLNSYCLLYTSPSPRDRG